MGHFPFLLFSSLFFLPHEGFISLAYLSLGMETWWHRLHYLASLSLMLVEGYIIERLAW